MFNWNFATAVWGVPYGYLRVRESTNTVYLLISEIDQPEEPIEGGRFEAGKKRWDDPSLPRCLGRKPSSSKLLLCLVKYVKMGMLAKKQ